MGRIMYYTSEFLNVVPREIFHTDQDKLLVSSCVSKMVIQAKSKKITKRG